MLLSCTINGIHSGVVRFADSTFQRYVEEVALHYDGVCYFPERCIDNGKFEGKCF